MTPPATAWTFAATDFRPALLPRLMGILNVTPDSFSDGGRWTSIEAAVDHAARLVEDGADLIDVGGESTRPGATPVPVEEELRRIVPVIRELADRVSVPISIDTRNSAVAAAALENGATIVNDVSGLMHDAAMPAVCREHAAGIVCMHSQGTPQTMQINPQYDDVVAEVETWFRERLETLTDFGIAPERVVLDPGIGFGKTATHNVELLAAVPRFAAVGRPVLVGHSRKRFLKHVLGREIDEPTAGTIGVAVALAELRVDYLRVHDVGPVRDALLAWKTVIDRAASSGKSPFMA